MSIKTKGCNLLIDNVTELFGIFDIESSSVRDFVQPASFREQYAVLPPGLNTPIVWMHYKDTRPAAEYKFERENDQSEQYRIDLIIPEQQETIVNVMRKNDRMIRRCRKLLTEHSFNNDGAFLGSFHALPYSLTLQCEKQNMPISTIWSSGIYVDGATKP